jgi:ethanolamine utilization protein EutN
MILAEVLGNVVATRKLAVYEGFKILVVRPVKPDGSPAGASFLAVDTVQSGAGDIVLIIDEGNSARQIIDDTMAPIRSVIVGIVDQVTV